MQVFILLSVCGVVLSTVVENGLDKAENLTEVQEVGTFLLKNSAE